MKVLEIPPHAPTLIESTRAIGYSLEAAVADVIDNSIAADSSNIQVFFFPMNSPYLAIIDDGIGMSEETINNAMQYGSKNPNDSRSERDLGRFGLGLKTASLSQCRVLTVISKQGTRVVGRAWDIDFVNQTGKWSLLILDESHWEELPHIDRLLSQDHGTLVLWQKLDRLIASETNFETAFGRRMDLVRDHLELVFHRFLSGETGLKKLQLSINNNLLISKDPFLSSKSTQAIDDEVFLYKGEKITVRPYILPHTSKLNNEEIDQLGGKEGLRKKQGFYVYRNKRLIVWGTWFRMMRQGEFSKLVRIQVDIPNSLDNFWTLDIKKSTAIPPAEIRSGLESIIEQMALKSKRTWTYRGKKETDDKITRIWNRYIGREGEVFYTINRDHPFVKELLASDHRSLVDTLLRQIENGLLVNMMYIDLTNDVKLVNQSDFSEPELEKMITEGLKLISQKEHFDFLTRLKFTEPFVLFPDLIDRYLRGNS